KQFLHTFCNAPEFKQAVFTFPFQQSDPLHYLNGLDAQNEFLFFNEKTSHQKTIAAGGSLKEITAAGPNRFAVIQRKIEALKSETLHLNATANAQNGFHILGGFSFFDHIETGGWRNFKSASFTLPKRAIIKNGATSLSVSVEKYPNCSPEEI